MVKPVILFIQGGGEGAYEEDEKLVAFLKEALRGDYVINYPRMPDENDPDYEPFKTKIEEELKKIDTKVVLVGHSLGGSVLLKFLSENHTGNEIVAIFLIAPPFWGEGGWEYDGFKLKEGFASGLPANVPVFFYHSNDDAIVPFSHLALYTEKMPRAKICSISGRGHQLNNDLTEVVRDIRSLSL